MFKSIRRVLTVSAVLSFSCVSMAAAQNVILVNGTGIQPSNLTIGRPVPPGTRIEVPRNAVVILEEQWPSDRPKYNCIGWVIISGTIYQAMGRRTDGSCPVVTEGGNELERVRRGESFTTRAVFYGEAKYDDSEPTPSVVSQSLSARRALSEQFRELNQIRLMTIEVPAQASWAATGITLMQGERVDIVAEGQWSNGGVTPQMVGPDGFGNFRFDGTPVVSANLASLIGRVETTQFAVGSRFGGPSPASGQLFLMMNDTPDSLGDNLGALRVTISVRRR